MKRLWALFLICGCGCLDAHEQPTHVNITSKALQYLASTNARPNILQLYSQLTDGAWNEDAFFPGYPGYLGRFYFHFLPTLNNLGQSATCDSVAWGIFGSSCTASTIVPLIASTTTLNNHSWQNAINDADPITAVPTNSGWTDIGYVIHLLEDLTSPPHTHNSAHPCVAGFAFCDPFEPLNNGAAINAPFSEYVDFNGVTGPQDFFTRVQAYTANNYFSARTVFGGVGPTSTFEDASYFYGSCLPASVDFGTCFSINNRQVRRIAYKGLAYYLTSNPANAQIDSFTAHDQFSELGPVAVQAVADFIKFYAPELTIQVTGSGTGTGTVTSTGNAIDCPANACISVFVNGNTVALKAIPDSGSVFTSWGIDCNGSSPTTSVLLSQDRVCTAKFDLGGILTVTKSGTGTGTVSSAPAGINCGPTCTGPQTAPFPANPPVTLTATFAAGSIFSGWGGACASAGTNVTVQVTLTAAKTCDAKFDMGGVLVRLNPFGNQNGTVPYSVQVVDSILMVTPAPQTVTVTLLREVFSECSGLLFSSNRTVVVSQGQSSATFNFDAGHDPSCNTLPITTVYTLTNAVLAPSTVLDLRTVPPQQLKLFSIH